MQLVVQLWTQGSMIFDISSCKFCQFCSFKLKAPWFSASQTLSSVTFTALSSKLHGFKLLSVQAEHDLRPWWGRAWKSETERHHKPKWKPYLNHWFRATLDNLLDRSTFQLIYWIFRGAPHEKQHFPWSSRSVLHKHVGAPWFSSSQTLNSVTFTALNSKLHGFKHLSVQAERMI